MFAGLRADIKPYAADVDVAVVPGVYADPLPRAAIVFWARVTRGMRSSVQDRQGLGRRRADIADVRLGEDAGDVEGSRGR